MERLIELIWMYFSRRNSLMKTRGGTVEEHNVRNGLRTWERIVICLRTVNSSHKLMCSCLRTQTRTHLIITKEPFANCSFGFQDSCLSLNYKCQILAISGCTAVYCLKQNQYNFRSLMSNCSRIFISSITRLHTADPSLLLLASRHSSTSSEKPGSHFTVQHHFLNVLSAGRRFAHSVLTKV